METYLIGLALCLVVGLMLSRLTKLLHMPAVTAYLLAGLLLGPFCLGLLNIPGIGFHSLEQVETMSIVTQTALGKYLGSGLSCRLTGQSKPICEHLGITLLPQAGVALGMALTASSLPDGALVRNVVLFGVLIYELVGPTLTKRSLTAAGEIQPEGRTSARTPNKT